MRLPTFAALVFFLATQAQAHEGHGLAGSSHWHASDSFGWLMALAVIAVGYLISRK